MPVDLQTRSRANKVKQGHIVKVIEVVEEVVEEDEYASRPTNKVTPSRSLK